MSALPFSNCANDLDCFKFVDLLTRSDRFLWGERIADVKKVNSILNTFNDHLDIIPIYDSEYIQNKFHYDSDFRPASIDTDIQKMRGLFPKGNVVSFDELKPGDVVFFHNSGYPNLNSTVHAAIFLSDNIVVSKIGKGPLVFGNMKDLSRIYGPDIRFSVGRSKEGDDYYRHNDL